MHRRGNDLAGHRDHLLDGQGCSDQGSDLRRCREMILFATPAASLISPSAVIAFRTSANSCLLGNEPLPEDFDLLHKLLFPVGQEITHGGVRLADGAPSRAARNIGRHFRSNLS